MTPIDNIKTKHLSLKFSINGKSKRHILHSLIYTLFNKNGKLTKENQILFIDNNYKNINFNNLKIISNSYIKKLQLSNKIIKNIEYDNKIWKPIKNYETKYLINQSGEIKSLITGKLLKINNSGLYINSYKRISLTKNNESILISVHKLVFCTYKNIDFENLGCMVIDHIDRNTHNNNLNNLRLVSRSENSKNRDFTKKKIIVQPIKCNNFTKILKYENLDFSNYEINEYGQIRNIINKKILSEHKIIGYKTVLLTYKNINNIKINKNCKTLKVHRLVATVFIPNPNNYPVVHHKDENRSNNHISNLEWTTFQQNTIYSIGKKVIQYSLDDKFIKVHNTIISAAKSINKNKSTNISRVCKGNVKTSYGFKWKYYDEKTDKHLLEAQEKLEAKNIIVEIPIVKPIKKIHKN